MYKLKNISNNTLDILGKFIKPGEEIRSMNLNPYKKLISSGFLTILEDNDVSLITLPKNKYNVKRNSHYINQQIISNINSKFPLREKREESSNIDQIISDKLDKINTDINSKIDQILKDEKIYSSELNNIIENKVKEQVEKTNIFKIEQSKIDNKDILESLFHFYIDRDISKQDLKNIKYFLINISEIKNIPEELKNDINNAQSYEELITVLLNNVYPYLFLLD